MRTFYQVLLELQNGTPCNPASVLGGRSGAWARLGARRGARWRTLHRWFGTVTILMWRRGTRNWFFVTVLHWRSGSATRFLTHRLFLGTAARATLGPRLWMALGAWLATRRATVGLAGARTRAWFLRAGLGWRLWVGPSLGSGVGAALAARTGARARPWAASWTPAPTASAARATSAAGPGPAARVRASSFWLILYQTDFPPVDVGAVQLVQSPLHIRMAAKLDHTFICAFLVGIGVGHLTGLPHEVLEVLPAASTGQVLDNKSVLGADRWSVFVSARAAPAAVTTTTFRHKVREKSEKHWEDQF